MSFCPLDDRYYEELNNINLSKCLDEKEFIKNRYLIELYYLQSFFKFIKNSKKCAEFSDLTNEYFEEFEEFLLTFDKNLTDKDYDEIKLIEKTTKHDVKSIEIFLRQKIPKKFCHYIHFGLTSQDVNSLGFMIGFYKMINILQKVLIDFEKEIENLLLKSKDIVMCAKTHVQFAVPTFLDKEIYVKYEQIHKYVENLNEFSKKLTCKMGGAIGNLNAHYLCFPDLDWNIFFDNLVDNIVDIFFENHNKIHENKIHIKRSVITTQVDNYCSINDILQCNLDILLYVKNFNTYCYSLINDKYFYQLFDKNQVGSSVMPQKINPIDFENSKGNNNIAKSLTNSIKEHLSSEISFQRDISDSTVLRSVITAFGYTILSILKFIKGLKTLEPNLNKINEDLESNPQIIMEGIQTYLKCCGIQNSYEISKDFCRGKNINIQNIHSFIDLFDINDFHKEKLKSLKINEYVGIKPTIKLYHQINNN